MSSITQRRVIDTPPGNLTRISELEREKRKNLLADEPTIIETIESELYQYKNPLLEEYKDTLIEIFEDVNLKNTAIEEKIIQETATLEQEIATLEQDKISLITVIKEINSDEKKRQEAIERDIKYKYANKKINKKSDFLSKSTELKYYGLECKYLIFKFINQKIQDNNSNKNLKQLINYL